LTAEEIHDLKYINKLRVSQGGCPIDLDKARSQSLPSLPATTDVGNTRPNPDSSSSISGKL